MLLMWCSFNSRSTHHSSFIHVNFGGLTCLLPGEDACVLRDNRKAQRETCRDSVPFSVILSTPSHIILIDCPRILFSRKAALKTRDLATVSETIRIYIRLMFLDVNDNYVYVVHPSPALAKFFLLTFIIFSVHQFFHDVLESSINWPTNVVDFLPQFCLLLSMKDNLLSTDVHF